MNASVAYDFAPAARLLLLAFGLALLPLLWWLWRHRGQTPASRHRALAMLTLFLCFDLTLFGAFTRLSDSGLGCPDWPGCYGQTSPLGAAAQIQQEQAALPSGPVTHSKAWIEMLHRYWAMVVGVLIIGLVLSAWRQPDRRLRLLAAATLVWVCVQGAFGAFTVSMRLFPAIVTLHLLGALLLLVLLLLQWRQSSRQSIPQPLTMAARQQPLAWAAVALLAAQIALGGWVSSNYAVMACSDFPTCQGSFWPDMNFAQGFELWRDLGMTASGRPISFAALTAIHMVHRGMALVVVGLLLTLAWQLSRTPGGRQPARFLMGLTGLQVATGLGNALLGWPLLAALLHTGGAAALLLTLVWVLTEPAGAVA
jgi:cytochrome c oxidase assembly protein subunit 15